MKVKKTKNNTIGIRPRIQLDKDDFIEALKQLSNEEKIEIIYDLVDTLDNSSSEKVVQLAVKFYKSLNANEKFIFKYKCNNDFENVEMIQVESSFIKEYGYDQTTNALLVCMRNGNKYLYEKVNPDCYYKLLASSADVGSSTGKAYNLYIKESFRCHKLEDN